MLKTIIGTIVLFAIFIGTLVILPWGLPFLISGLGLLLYIFDKRTKLPTLVFCILASLLSTFGINNYIKENETFEKYNSYFIGSTLVTILLWVIVTLVYPNNDASYIQAAMSFIPVNFI